MDKNEQFLIVAALAGLAWLAWTRHGVASVMPTVITGAAATVPWYANYNATPPVVISNMPVLPVEAVGTQTSTDNCPGCSMFGVSYGSQF